MNIQLTQKNLIAVSNKLRLGLYGLFVKSPNGNVRTDLRGVDANPPPTIHDQDFQLWQDYAETARAALQAKKSDGYLHYDPTTEVPYRIRNQARVTTRLEVENDFLGVFKVTRYIDTTTGVQTFLDGEYILITESTGTYNKNELYYQIDGTLRKVWVTEGKVILMGIELPDFKYDRLYIYRTISNTWEPVNNNWVTNYLINSSSLGLLHSFQSNYTIKNIIVTVLTDCGVNDSFTLYINSTPILTLDNIDSPYELLNNNTYTIPVYTNFLDDMNGITYDSNISNAGSLKILIEWADRFYY